MWIVIPVVLIALLLFAVAPGRCEPARRTPFLHRYFAHRGLYEKDQSVPENSLIAFSAAVEAGYGVELDVQITQDGQLVVFHDMSLQRVLGVDAHIESFTYAELTERVRLFGTDERIPLLLDVLSVLKGRVPIIAELKPSGDLGMLCARTLAMLEAYGGEFCVESFDPRIVRWFYKHAPHILRGQLSEPMHCSRPMLGTVKSFCASHLLLNFLARPQFIAYRVGDKPWTVRLCERMGAMRVCWTAHAGDDAARLESAYDAVIFEHYRPKLCY